MADIPEISKTEKKEKIKKMANIGDGTITYLFEDYFYREPLLDKFYNVSVKAEKWDKYIASGGKDIY